MKKKEKKKPLQLFNKSKFIWSTDKEKWRGFFQVHMTAIWGYCVFWPKRVVYDRWQERKSQAAGLSTDMQIAFSWLLYSAWYLSSGLQHASLFTARKQLIGSTKGKRKESWCFHSVAWKQKPLEWPESTKLIRECIVFYHTETDDMHKYRCGWTVSNQHWV